MYFLLYVLIAFLTYFLGLLIQGDDWCDHQGWDDETPVFRALASIFWPKYKGEIK